MKKNLYRQPKYKKAKRLLNLLKYRRHKKIRESIFNSRKKIFHSHNRLKQKCSAFLKKDKLGIYEIEPCAVTESARELPNRGQTVQKQGKDAAVFAGFATESFGAELSSATALSFFHKKKYKIQSYLFNVIFKFPRKYVYRFLGKDILRRYYTMPFRPSLSRFISTKVLRSYYCGGRKNLGRKALLGLCQKASGRKTAPTLRDFKGGKLLCGAEGSIFKEPLKPSDQALQSPALRLAGGQGAEKKDAVVGKPSETNEVAKNFVLCLEERLDSSLLRLLHFKPLYSSSSAKRALFPGFNLFQGRKRNRGYGGLGREAKVTKYPKYQIKAPWANFSAKQVRQMISHGHIQINGKKVKSPNTQIRLRDQIQIKGFVKTLADHATKSDDSASTPKTPTSQPQRKRGLATEKAEQQKTMQTNHIFTMLLRRFKDQTCLGVSGPPQPSESEKLYKYIKGLKIKRFTEAFYMTYRNLHLIERTSATAVAPTEGFEGDVEKHIQPVFDTIGFNQSIYLLWPVISLLRARSWNSVAFRQNLSPSSSANSTFFADQTRQEKKKLQNLLKWKKLQTSEEKISGTSGMPTWIRAITLKNPSWLYTKSSRSYASIVYGTRKCKWIKLQQGSQGYFYNQIPNQTQFFQLELEFFQAVYRGVRRFS